MYKGNKLSIRRINSKIKRKVFQERGQENKAMEDLQADGGRESVLMII